MEWEFTYVYLWLGGDQTIKAVQACQVEIAKLGKAGWEPVGEVTFRFREPNKVLGADTNVRQLMFKRPVSASN